MNRTFLCLSTSITCDNRIPGEVIDNRLRSEIGPFRKYRRNLEDRKPKAVIS